MIIDVKATYLDVKKSQMSFKIRVADQWIKKGYSIFYPGSDFCFLEIFNDCNHFYFYKDYTYDCKIFEFDMFDHELLSATLYSFKF